MQCLVISGIWQWMYMAGEVLHHVCSKPKHHHTPKRDVVLQPPTWNSALVLWKMKPKRVVGEGRPARLPLWEMAIADRPVNHSGQNPCTFTLSSLGAQNWLPDPGSPSLKWPEEQLNPSPNWNTHASTVISASSLAVWLDYPRNDLEKGKGEMA